MRFEILTAGAMKIDGSPNVTLYGLLGVYLRFMNFIFGRASDLYLTISFSIH